MIERVSSALCGGGTLLFHYNVDQSLGHYNDLNDLLAVGVAGCALVGQDSFLYVVL